MKGIKKSILLLVLLFVIICIPASVYASADTQTPAEETETKEENQSANKSGNIDTDDFSIKVVCGIQGHYKYNVAVPVNIDIESKNEDFSGIIRMIVPGSDWNGTEAMAYEKEILLTAGSSKHVTLSVFGLNVATKLTFQLEDEKGKIIIDEPVKIGSKVNQNAIVGVLSDDYTALNYFDKLAITKKYYEGEVELVELKADIMPDHASGLEAISFIVINSFDTSKLSSEQLTALKDWVSQGGILIIGGGSDCKQTVSGLTDMIQLRKVQNTSSTFEIESSDIEEAAATVEFKENQGLVETEIEGATDLSGVISDSALIKNLAYNKGQVVVTGFNLGMEPVSSWTDKAAFAKKLYEASAIGYSAQRLSNVNFGAYQDIWSIRSVLDLAMDNKYPHVIAIIIILAVFVLFGPIIYFVLKKFDKRELLWIIIPVCAVCFTVIIFIANADVRIRYPVSKSITVMYEDGEESEESNAVSVAMGIMVPGTKHTEVMTDRNLTNLKVYNGDEEYYDGQSSNIQWNNDYTSSVRQTADGYLLGYDNKSTFQTKYVNFDYTGSVEMGDGISTEYKRTVTGISGKVTNNTNYDLTQVCIYTYGKAVTLGDIKKGETVEFNETDNKSFFDMDLYSLKYPGLNTDTKLYNQILNAYVLAYSSYMMDDIETDRSSVFVTGYISKWECDYIPDDDVAEYNKAVYIKKDNIGYSDYEDAEIANLFSFAKNTNAYDVNDGQIYVTPAEVEYDVSQAMNHVYALIRAKDSERRYGDTKNTRIYAWNFDTEQYDEIFVNDIIMKFEDDCPYLDENGIIKIKFTAKTVYNDYAPFITVVGGEE